jgi:hypothetical protein
VNIETKQQLQHTYLSNKFKQTLSTRKMMKPIFWDRKGAPMVEFMQQGTTAMSEVCCKTQKKMCTAIQNKWHGILTSGVVFLHDSVHLHTGACT